MISRDELMHHRLQAWLRENHCDDMEYLGDWDGKHWYRVGPHEVSADQIEDLELVGEVEVND